MKERVKNYVGHFNDRKNIKNVNGEGRVWKKGSLRVENVY